MCKRKEAKPSMFLIFQIFETKDFNVIIGPCFKICNATVQTLIFCTTPYLVLAEFKFDAFWTHKLRVPPLGIQTSVNICEISLF